MQIADSASGGHQSHHNTGGLHLNVTWADLLSARLLDTDLPSWNTKQTGVYLLLKRTSFPWANGVLIHMQGCAWILWNGQIFAAYWWHVSIKVLAPRTQNNGETEVALNYENNRVDQHKQHKMFFTTLLGSERSLYFHLKHYFVLKSISQLHCFYCFISNQNPWTKNMFE